MTAWDMALLVLAGLAGGFTNALAGGATFFTFPALLAIGSFAVLHAWNEYLYAFLMLSSEQQMTLTVAMGLFVRDDDAPWPVLMALGVIYALPPTALYYAVRKYMVTGLTAGGVKG